MIAQTELAHQSEMIAQTELALQFSGFKNVDLFSQGIYQALARYYVVCSSSRGLFCGLPLGFRCIAPR